LNQDELLMKTSNNVPLKFKAFHLEQLIDKYFGYNIHQKSQNGLRCDDCEKKGVENYFGFNKFYFLNPPAILVVVLKRFRQTKWSVQKEDKNVPISLELDLSKYLLSKRNRSSNSISSPSLKYSLYGIVEQHGSLSFGHYICYVKKESGTWYYISDSHYSKTSENDIKRNEGGYILFYKRHSE